MKNTPQGLGIWIWETAQCSGGDWNAIAAKCKAAGIKWITAKAGDSNRDAQWTSAYIKSVIQICHDNGIMFGTWNYSIPSTASEQVVQIKSLFDDGIDFHILDPEEEWEQDVNNVTDCDKFMQSLRQAVGNDVYIGYAPFAIPQYHTKYPYKEFNKYCDAVHTQLYWCEFDWTIQRAITTHDQGWAAFNKANPSVVIPVCPIGNSYGKGYPGVPGTLSASDIKTFIDHYDQTLSFYSYDAATNFPTWGVLDAANAQNLAPSALPIEIPEPLPVPDPVVAQDPVEAVPQVDTVIASADPAVAPSTPGWSSKLIDIAKSIAKVLLHIK